MTTLLSTERAEATAAQVAKAFGKDQALWEENSSGNKRY